MVNSMFGTDDAAMSPSANLPRSWQIAPPVAPDPALLALVGHQPIAAAALIRRGFGDPARASRFLDPGVYTPAPPTDLPDMAEAVALIADAIRDNQPILIWGDFDADGQTSTALLYDALQPVAASIALYIPDRLKEGHGITVAALKAQLAAIQKHIARKPLIITCDTGITAYDAIGYASSIGISVIVTDHHEMAADLPPADAIINPHRLPPDHPMASLPGVGVAFQVIVALAERGLIDGIERFLDLVALGIVADVAQLTDDTRYWLQRGIERLRRTDRPGLRALFEEARLDIERAGAEQIGFQIGPRLNAAGRIGDPLHAVELLVTSDPLRSLVLADELEGLNRRRRQMQRQIEAEANDLLAADPALAEQPVLVLYREQWAAGLLGPAIGGLVEKYNRPVILLTAADALYGQARGSARSAAGFDLNAALVQSADLLTSYGGHAEAAGLILPIGNIPALRRSLNYQLQQHGLATAQQTDPLIIDYIAPLDSLTLEAMSTLAALAPFGEGNPPVTLLAEGVRITSAKFLDRAHIHRRLVVEDGNGKRYPVYWWNSGSIVLPEGAIDMAYTLAPDPDSSRDGESGYGFRITLTDWHPSATITTSPKPARQVIDMRESLGQAAAADLTGVIAMLGAKLGTNLPGELQIWAEGFAQRESPGVGRDQLAAGEPLLIATAPPDQATLRAVLDTFDPPLLYVLAADPPPPFNGTSAAIFARELHGIVRFVMQRQDGIIDRTVLCSRVAQSEKVVRYALRGLPRLAVADDGDQWRFTLSDRGQAGDEWLASLGAMLTESRAYRDYLQKASIASLTAQMS